MQLLLLDSTRRIPHYAFLIPHSTFLMLIRVMMDVQRQKLAGRVSYRIVTVFSLCLFGRSNIAAFLFGKPETAAPVGSKLGYSYLRNTSQGTRLDVPPVDFIEDELFQYDAKSVFPSLIHDLALMRWQGRTAKLQLQLSRDTYIQYLPGPIGPTYRTRDTMLSVKPCCSQ